MVQKYKTAACIVIYCPDIKRLDENIKAAIKQVDELILVLNSKEEEIYSLLGKYSSIKILGKGRNEGIAQAINYAIDYCYDKAFDWLLTLDQDSVCPEGLVKRYCEEIKEQIGIITCGVDYNQQMIKTEAFSTFVEGCIQSGAFLDIKIAHELGGMDSKMFIDQVDFEYCYRLRQHGYKILQINDMTLEHQLGDLNIKKIGPITFYVGNHSAFRKYYMARNAIYCNMIHPEWRSKTFCLKKITGLVLKTLIFEEDKFAKLYSIYKGVKDAPEMTSVEDF